MTPDGKTDRADDADVLVQADDDGVTIATDGRQHPFSDVTTDQPTPRCGEGEP
ncbi:hypothetical protein ACFQH8_06450 [Halomicroarcula sp. GCM10025710]